MKRLGVLLMVLPLIAAQATFAVAAPRATVAQQDDQLPPPTPLDDPYAPPAGDPDIFAPEPSEEPSPLNPAGD
jgi:hypothetical protein